MDILNLFIKFVNQMLDFKIFGISLLGYLITITIIVIIITIVKHIAN